MPEPGLTPPPAATAVQQGKRRLPIWARVVLTGVGLIAAILLSPIFTVIFLVVLITGIVALAKNKRTWLGFPNRRVATWVTAISAVGFLLTGSLANLVMGGSEDEKPASVVAPIAAPIETSPAVETAAPAPTPTPTSTPVDVISVVDGDTIDTTAGAVRLIGIDTPEQGAWGYDEARDELERFLAAGSVTLVSVEDRDDIDRYDRLLRYVRVDGEDAGAHMIRTGWAIARYDGRDGYGTHPLQGDYVTSDAAHEMPAEPAPEPAEPAPAQPSTDPQFGTCGEANDNGYGDYQAGVDAEYDWYRDGDGDGWVCER